MKLLDRKLKPAGFQKWVTHDGFVRVELRHDWSYLGGGESSSKPLYILTVKSGRRVPIVHKPTEVLAAIEKLDRERAKGGRP